MEYSLTYGKPQKTKAMEAGSARHVVLEKEVYFFGIIVHEHTTPFSLLFR